MTFSTSAFSLRSLGRRVDVPSVLIAPSQSAPPPSISAQNQQTLTPSLTAPPSTPAALRSHTAQDHRPLKVTDLCGSSIRDSETCTHDPNNTEGREEDPSGLATETVAEEEEDVGEEEDGVDDQFGHAELFVGLHDAQSTILPRETLYLFLSILRRGKGRSGSMRKHRLKTLIRMYGRTSIRKCGRLLLYILSIYLSIHTHSAPASKPRLKITLNLHSLCATFPKTRSWFA